MEKVIVTHFCPDVDALSSIWVIKRFLSGWEKAEVRYVSAGETWEGKAPDEDPNMIHVDTGLGRFDHHGKKEFNSATSLCSNFVLTQRDFKELDREALVRMVGVITEIDNGQEISWPEAESDRYEFMLNNFFDEREDSVEFGLTVLDSIFQAFKKKIKAEEILEEDGIVFESKWGRAIAVETANDNVLTVGQRQGYVLVVKKNPKTGFLRIYGRWDKDIDLTEVYEKFKKEDPEATWYLHPSRCLLLNGSKANPKMVPTKLSLKEAIEILRG